MADEMNEAVAEVPIESEESSETVSEETDQAEKRESKAVKERKKGNARLRWALRILTKEYDPNVPYWRHILKAEKDYLELGLEVVGSVPRAAEVSGVSQDFYTARLRAHGLSARRLKKQRVIKSPKDDTLI